LAIIVALFPFRSTQAQAATLASSGNQLSLQRAEDAFKTARYDEALSLFSAALKNPFITPRDRAHALCRKGLISSIRNGFSEAQENLEQSLKANLLPAEDQSTCAFALLQIYVGRGMNTEAVTLAGGMGAPALTPQYQARVWAFAAESARKIADTKNEVIYLQRLRQTMESKGIKEVPLKILGHRVVSLAEVNKRLGTDAQETQTSPAAAPQAPSPAPASKSDETAPSAAAMKTAQVSQDATQSSANLSAPLAASSPAPSPASGATPVPETTSTAQSNDRYQKLATFINTTLRQTELGDWNGAKQRWSLLSERNLVGPLQLVSGFSPNVEAILARLESIRTSEIRNLRIGILVPSDPEFSTVSFRVLRAASAFLASPGSNGIPIEIFVRSAAADPGAVEGAAVDLILGNNVHAIIGPISSALTLGAVAAVRPFGVPLFALGPVSDSATLSSPYLIRMGVQARSQSMVLVPHLKEQGLTNFAILAPNDAYGLEMTRAMSTVAAEQGMPVERTTYYDSESDVFKDGVEAALGSQDKAARKEEFEAAAEELRKQALLEKRKFDPAEVKLPPIVRFDALFVPDSLRRARVIASTFAFLDAKNLRFVGDRQWSENDNRRSIADDFLNGARAPVATPGKYLGHLVLNLGGIPENPRAAIGMDLERQVFDAFLLARQGHFLAGGLNGNLMVRGLKEKTWNLEGTTLISGLSPSGEPLTKFELKAFVNGGLTSDVPPWSGETWQEDLAAWVTAQSPGRKNQKTNQKATQKPAKSSKSAVQK
jgi:hypothetical protein